MKRVLPLLLALLLVCTVFMTACNKEADPAASPTPATTTPAVVNTPEEPAKTPDPTPPPAPVTIYVFAAASMTETINTIIENYKAVAPHVTIVPTYDSSGTLLTQIQEGAEADIFISAAQKQMNTLADANALADGTRFNIVENQVALVVPPGNPDNIHTFDDAIAAASIALGNSDVPVGQYSEEIFTNLGVWDAVSAKATLGTNVKEVTSWVKEGVVSCGIVYATDAFSAGLEIVASAPEGSLKTPVIYPAAMLEASANKEAAADFLAYLKTPAASEVFESVGFVIPG